jgi:hypothetical protein
MVAVVDYAAAVLVNVVDLATLDPASTVNLPAAVVIAAFVDLGVMNRDTTLVLAAVLDTTLTLNSSVAFNPIVAVDLAVVLDFAAIEPEDLVTTDLVVAVEPTADADFATSVNLLMM